MILTMKCRNKTLCRRLILPLMAVSALILLIISSKPAVNYNRSRSAFRSLGNYTPPVEFRPMVMASAGEDRQEALSADYNHRRAEPPLAIEAGAEPPASSDKQGDFLTTTLANQSNDVPRIVRRFSSLQLLEANLQKSRTAIKQADGRHPDHDPDYVPTGPVYWNSSAFHRSYLEMEKQFKVFIYEEGEQPIFHHGPCGSIYSMEGNFIYKLETSPFRTKDPEKAHVFFLPFSVVSIVRFIFDRSLPHYWGPMKGVVKDYIHLLSEKYPYWNRSLGFDHFMLSCHDWGPELSKSVPELFKNSIRALCNANTSEGFQPSKDVSIPEINMVGRRMNGLVGGPSPSKRPILAFFAGGVHGPIRPILLEHWENKDPDVRIQKYLPKNVSYQAMMRKSRYCICPSGYEVASPRMVESLYMGCVPVLIKDHYVPPFSDVLNWKSFAVVLSVEDIPRLKDILTKISTRQYLRLHRRGLSVRRHFEMNLPPKRYDVLHMTLHSIWLRRLNIDLHGVKDS